MSIWNAPSTGPLAGLRVIDLSTTLMGPYCSLLLAQMGADVIKVEAPRGDILRFIGDRNARGLGPAFLNVNRGKRSVVLDLKSAPDHAALLDMTADADVLCHSLRPSAAKRLGIQYDRISQVNPRIIYCSMYGYGQGGPYADRPAYDDVVQGASGTAALQGDGAPHYVRTAYADKTVGLMAVSAVLAALYERGPSDQGQAIDVPMFECMVSINAVEQMGGLVYDPQDGPAGYSRTASAYRKPYATKDGFLSVLIYTDRQWMAFFELIGRPELSSEPKFRTIRERTLNIDELYRLLEAAVAQRTTAKWLASFDEADIPAMQVVGLGDLIEDPQAVASGIFESVLHPVEGKLRQPGLGWTFGRTPPEIAAPAPLLGEHTSAVLGALPRASVSADRGASERFDSFET